MQKIEITRKVRNQNKSGDKGSKINSNTKKLRCFRK